MSPENMADTGTPIQYQQCFVAFLDILGFKKKIMESQDRSEKLKILIESLSICGKFSSGGKKVTGQGLVPMQSRFFSDSVVFFTKQDNANLVQLLFLVRYLQDRLWEKGICLRGAITMGDMYWPKQDNEITVGPALLDAYRQEQKIAIYPRILVSSELYHYVENRSVKAYPFGQSGTLKSLIRQDADGLYYLDLLNENITRIKEESLNKAGDGTFSIYWIDANGSKHSTILGCVKRVVHENITSPDLAIRQKYEWLKTYLSKIEDKG